MFNDTVEYIRTLYNNHDFIPLHEPRFIGNEKKYLNECIDSTFVSYVGQYVNKFEKSIANYTNSSFALATTSGTSALHLALHTLGVQKDDEVITQALTFVATPNAISYLNARPILVDISSSTLGMCPKSLEKFLVENTYIKNNVCYNKNTKKKIKACIPMHTFGHSCEIDKIVEICNKFKVWVIEDAAESLGSYYKEKHTGTFGVMGVFSFNGNKTITSGGGGMIITNEENLFNRLKHLSTTAKINHPWEYNHDEVGFNYRLPNINAAIGLAQMESIGLFLEKKRELKTKYKSFFENSSIKFIDEPKYCKSNFWLNAILLSNKQERDDFLAYTNSKGVMTRPSWNLIPSLPPYKKVETSNIDTAITIANRLVNIPSSVILK